MPRFIYKAKRNPKETLEGKIEAKDDKDAVNKLRQMGIYPISIDSEDSITAAKSPLSFLKKGVSLTDLSTFTRQLSNLLDSGMTLINALDVLANQTQNKILVRAASDIKIDIKDGVSFSDALSRHPKVFPALYTNMVRSGEIGGMLEEVLSRLADLSEADEQTLSKVKTSLAYPILMMLVGAATIFVLLSFVAPRLVGMFSDLGQALPLPTVILIKVSNFFAAFWWLIILVAASLYIAIIRWAKTMEGKRVFDQAKLKLPIIGHFLKTAELARLSRTMATLIRNGVPMVEALDVLSKTSGNEILRDDLKKVRKAVVDGLSLSGSMKQSPLFPPMMINMINVGEESGSLEDSLFKIANSYDKEVDRSIKVFTTLLEPTLILVLGAVVGFIVIAMLLPIFQINLLVG